MFFSRKLNSTQLQGARDHGGSSPRPKGKVREVGEENRPDLEHRPGTFSGRALDSRPQGRRFHSQGERIGARPLGRLAHGDCDQGKIAIAHSRSRGLCRSLLGNPMLLQGRPLAGYTVRRVTGGYIQHGSRGTCQQDVKAMVGATLRSQRASPWVSPCGGSVGCARPWWEQSEAEREGKGGR